jgi:hypothetical protein
MSRCDPAGRAAAQRGIPPRRDAGVRRRPESGGEVGVRSRIEYLGEKDERDGLGWVDMGRSVRVSSLLLEEL